MPAKTPIKECLLSKSLISEGDCWLWQGATNHKGYGNLQGRMAHRIAFEIFIGPIPDGKQLDHLCMNKLCVNPWHVEPVTNQENRLRWAATLTHCPSGHPYDGFNLFIDSIGTKRCKKCSYGHTLAWAKRQRASQPSATSNHKKTWK